MAERFVPLWSRAPAWTAVLVVGLLVFWRPAASVRPALKPPMPADPDARRLVTLSPDSMELTRFTSEPVRVEPFVSKLTVAGLVEPSPDRHVQLNARVAGRVRRVLAGIGARVKAGEVLALIESEELHKAQVVYRLAQKKRALALQNLTMRKRLAELGEFSRPKLETARTRSFEQAAEAASATAEHAAAVAGLTEAQCGVTEREAFLKLAESKLALARRNAERARMLHGHGIVSRQDMEHAQAATEAARAEVSTAAAGVEQARARVQSARVRVTTAQKRQGASSERSVVTSEALAREESVARDGLHTNREVAEADVAYQQSGIEEEAALDDIELLGGKPGDMHEIAVTTPIAGVVTTRSASLWETVGTDRTLFTVLDLTTVWAQLHVYQADVPSVRQGLEFELRCDAIPGRSFKGRVAHVGLETDDATRSVKVRCEVAGEGLLRPGMLVTGEISGPPSGPLMTVPAEAVQALGEEQVVFVPVAPATFQVVRVQTGLKQAGRVAILAGLTDATRVVVRNAFVLKGQLLADEEESR